MVICDSESLLHESDPEDEEGEERTEWVGSGMFMLGVHGRKEVRCLETGQREIDLGDCAMGMNSGCLR